MASILGLAAGAAAFDRHALSEVRPPASTSAPRSLPPSSLLSEPVLERLQYWNDFWRELPVRKTCGQLDGTDPAQIAEVHRCRARIVNSARLYREIRDRYRVSISSEEIGGVPTEVFTPEQGVPPHNEQRVLINLHGGGFKEGWRTISHFESIPFASVARIKVISIDYRMAPQYSFPAASEDVAAVYAELIKRYDPRNIGIYGCSAGGLLTAQSIAWLQKENLPLPGAVGMFCGGGSYWSEGDSGQFAMLWSERPKTPRDDPYFDYLRNADPNDSLAYPVRSKKVMARFPPSLLITSTRDLALSSVVHTHAVLVQQWVPAELHVWEGLPHSFFVDPELPQSREVYEITARFFDRYLGKPHPDAETRSSAAMPFDYVRGER